MSTCTAGRVPDMSFESSDESTREQVKKMRNRWRNSSYFLCIHATSHKTSIFTEKKHIHRADDCTKTVISAAGQQQQHLLYCVARQVLRAR